MANPSFGSDVAAILPLATLRTAVVQRPLDPLKKSTALDAVLPARVQRISIHLQPLKARLPPPNTCPLPIPAAHNLATSTTQTKLRYVPFLKWPPANIANPSFGSDVAANSPLATLRTAVVQRPLDPLKKSTALDAVLPARVQRISIHLQSLKTRVSPPNTCPPRLQQHTILQYHQLKPN
jgi:hypothetical protein